MFTLTLQKTNDAVYRVMDGVHGHVGNLKWIAGQWKFKAVGYGTGGELIPGGGPLTRRHNSIFSVADEALIAVALAAPT